MFPGRSPVLQRSLMVPCGVPLVAIKPVLGIAGMHDFDTVAIAGSFGENGGGSDAQALFIAALDGRLRQRASQGRSDAIDQHVHATTI